MREGKREEGSKIKRLGDREGGRRKNRWRERRRGREGKGEMKKESYNRYR